MAIRHQILQSLMEELGEDFPCVLAAYLAKIPPRLEAIRQAEAQQDLRQLGNVAHTLKGISRQFGADQLADLCQELETVGKNGDHTVLPALVQALLQEAALVEGVLKNLGECKQP